MKTFLFSIIVLFISHVNAQVGIGTNSPDSSAILDVSSTQRVLLFPRMTTAQRTSITSPAAGLHVFDTNTNSAWFFDGTYWVNYATLSKYGDVKSGIQSADHDGWVLLDGRALNTLSATQQTVVSSLGLSGNLPDATDSYLVQNGGAMASVTGTNTTTLSQANLPNVTFTGTSSNAGSHTHVVDPPPITTNSAGSHTHSGNTNTTGNHSHAGNAVSRGGNGGTGRTLAVGDSFNYGTYTPSVQSAGNHSHTLSINSSGTHNHSVNVPATTSTNNGDHSHTVTVNSGGTNEPVNIAPKSLTVNMFIYLGY